MSTSECSEHVLKGDNPVLTVLYHMSTVWYNFIYLFFFFFFFFFCSKQSNCFDVIFGIQSDVME